MRSIAGLLLLAAFGASSTQAQYQYPFRNPDLPIEERVNNIISLMTLDEKVAFLSSRPGVPRLGITAMGHVEGLHGLAMGGPSNWGRRNPSPIGTRADMPSWQKGERKSKSEWEHPRQTSDWKKT